MNHNTYPIKDKGHIEMQQELLRGLQWEISNRLFMNGAVSEIMATKLSADRKPYGTKLDVEGVAQLDHLYGPTWHYRRENEGKPDERRIKTLGLAIINEGPNNSRGMAYYDLGEFDEQGFMHVLPNVHEDAAWAVYGEAVELEILKTGTRDQPATLPNLEFNLLGIFNPHTALMAAPTKPTTN